jgi:hypothetical protein
MVVLGGTFNFYVVLWPKIRVVDEAIFGWSCWIDNYWKLESDKLSKVDGYGDEKSGSLFVVHLVGV